MIVQKRRFFWYAIGIGVSLLFFLILLSSVLSVGERLRRIHLYVEIGFYVMAFLLTYVLIINPVRIILFSPSFSLKTVLDEEDKKNYGLYKKVARNIIASNALPKEEVIELEASLKNYEALKKNLGVVYQGSLKKEMNKIIMKNAKTVMISTAISQNGRLDMLTVMVVNIRMIKELVVVCGFRPSMSHLSKLTLNVFTTALIAEGLENMNLDEILPASTTNALAEIPLIKPLISSVVQGISNALLTIRIGIVTRKYLFADGKEVTKQQIRVEALKESLKMLPIVVKEALAMFPNRVINLFKKQDKDSMFDFF